MHVETLRITPFLEHYKAYKENEKLQSMLNELVTALHPDNRAYLVDSPFQRAYEARLIAAEPELWDWYTWWLHEANEGLAGLEFSLGKYQQFNTRDYSLEEFLNLVIVRC
jgi:hypothetical protein